MVLFSALSELYFLLNFRSKTQMLQSEETGCCRSDCLRKGHNPTLKNRFPSLISLVSSRDIIRNITEAEVPSGVHRDKLHAVHELESSCINNICVHVSLNLKQISLKCKNDAKAHHQTVFNTDVPKWINHAVNLVCLSFCAHIQTFLIKASDGAWWNHLPALIKY